MRQRKQQLVAGAVNIADTRVYNAQFTRRSTATTKTFSVQYRAVCYFCWRLLMQGDHSSWKVMEKDDDVLDFFCKNALEFLFL